MAGYKGSLQKNLLFAHIAYKCTCSYKGVALIEKNSQISTINERKYKNQLMP